MIAERYYEASKVEDATLATPTPPPPPYPAGALMSATRPNHTHDLNDTGIAIGWGPNPPPPPPNHLILQPAGCYHPNKYGSISPAASTSITIQPQPPPATPTHYPPTTPATRMVVILGNVCPNCRIGSLMDDFDCFAIFLAILFFPLGIICCILMRRKRCSNCGVIY